MPNEAKPRRRWHSEISMMALLALNFFVVISLVMLVITGIAFATVDAGVISESFWKNPLFITLLLAAMCIIITAIVCFTVRGVILRPLNDMLGAMDQLKRGNFDVRAENGSRWRIREVDQFVDSFNATAQALGQTEVLRRDFISDFSHEFKTPIVSINGFAELLRDPATTSDERQEYAGIIAKESKRLVSLSSDILALRQTEALDRLPQADVECVRVDEQIRQALAIMQQKWPEKRLRFEVDLCEASVAGHAGFLSQMWTNLLDNACKFSPDEGCVRVSASQISAPSSDDAPADASTKHTKLHRRPRKAGTQQETESALPRLKTDGRELQKSAQNHAMLVVRIENDGPEVPPEKLERLFDRFYQADPSHATQGCGLGLPLVKRIAQLHEGSVSVESHNGHTTFEAQLPAE